MFFVGRNSSTSPPMNAIEALTISRDAIVSAINSLTAVPDGDPDLPAVLRFMIGRKQFEFNGPLRKAQALTELSRELRAIQAQISELTSASAGSQFTRLGVR